MSKTISIKIANSPSEIASFPLKQSIFLICSEELEDSLLKNNIAIIREPKEYGLLNMSELYNYNIGYVKEEFSSVDFTIESYQEDGFYKLKLTPLETLKPNSNYVLYIDKQISKEFIEVSKTVSKGPSSLILKSVKNISTVGDKKYTIKVMSSPKLTSTLNIIKFQIFENGEPGRYFTINAKSEDNLIIHEGFELLVADSAFGLGEEFEIITSNPGISLEESLVKEFKTTLSSNIAPLENVKESSALSNEDILKYYENLDKQTSTVDTNSIDFKDETWNSKEYEIEHLDENTFLLKLNKLNVDNLDLDNISYREFPSYNKYDLKLLNLYDAEDKYVLIPEILDQKTIIFTVVKEII